MTTNLFHLEHQMRTEVAARRQAAAQSRQAQAAQPPPSAQDPRILLRAGRLLLTWTVR